MRNRTLLIVGAALLLSPVAQADNPLDELTSDWRDDPVWHDGLAEIAVYEATRDIYGQSREYEARFMTNKEHASPKTFTKSDDGDGRAVFKFHVREDIPTAKYNYHYSTMCYVGSDDLKSLKIDMGAQEDCGATFKQFVNHNGKMRWDQHSYFPDEGHETGDADPPSDLMFFDALPLVLRGYPFGNPRDLALKALPEQTTNKLSPVRFEDYVVSYVGDESLSLPIGETEAHHLRLEFRGPTREARPAVDLWFDADPATRHVMVQYRGPGGQTYRLKSIKREAYWR